MWIIGLGLWLGALILGFDLLTQPTTAYKITLEEEQLLTNDVVFQPLTDTFLARSFFHLVIPINLTKFPEMTNRQLESCKKAKEIFGRVPNGAPEAIDLAMSEIKKQQAAFESIVQNLYGITRVPTQTVEAGETTGHLRRNKRQLLGAVIGSIIGGIGLGLGGAFSYFNHMEVSKLSGRVDRLAESNNRIINVLNVHEKHLHRLEQGLKELSELFETFIANRPFLLQQTLSTVIISNTEYLTTLKSLLDSAIQKRLSNSFLHEDVLASLLNQIRKHENDEKTSTLLYSTKDFFEQELTLIVAPKDKAIELVLHVPKFYNRDKFFAYRYVKTIFNNPIRNNSYLYPDIHDNNIMLTSKNNENGFGYLDEHEFQSCPLIGSTKVCHLQKDMALVKRANTTCLGSLFIKDLEAAEINCQFRTSVFVESAYEIFPNEWKIRTKGEEYMGKFICHNGQMESTINIFNAMTVELKPNCDLHTKDLILPYKNANTVIKKAVQFETWTLDIKKLVKLTHTEIEAVHKVKMIEKDMTNLTNQHFDLSDRLINVDNKLDNLHGYGYISFYSFGCIFIGVILIFTIILVCLCKRLKKAENIIKNGQILASSS